MCIKNPNWRLFFAIFLPFLCFFAIGRRKTGIVCLILQIVVIGWWPAALWAVYSLAKFETDEKLNQLRNNLNHNLLF